MGGNKNPMKDKILANNKTDKIQTKDMTTTRNEFFRNLKVAMRGIPYQIDGNHITAGETDNIINLDLLALPPREIGPTVSFERWQLTISFTTQSNDERTKFIHTFDRAFHRGGG